MVGLSALRVSPGLDLWAGAAETLPHTSSLLAFLQGLCFPSQLGSFARSLCFFLAPFRIFSFSLVLRNLIYSVSCCSFLHVPWLGFFELTGESEFTVLLKFQSSWPFRPQVFFLPRSPRSHYMCMRPREVAPQLTAAPFISLRSFFLCVSF